MDSPEKLRRDVDRMRERLQEEEKDMKKIRLLGERNGERVWYTFEGKCLVGLYQADGRRLAGHTSGTNQERLVFQAASGKLVVYEVGNPRDSPGIIRVFQSFDAMEAQVPVKLFEDAAIEAGVRRPAEYPEIPLEEAD
jgi:hypothetical protein